MRFVQTVAKCAFLFFKFLTVSITDSFRKGLQIFVSWMFVPFTLRCCMSCFQVEELVSLSLNQPMRLFVDNNTDVAHNLRQEFVRIRNNREDDRLAIVTGR